MNPLLKDFKILKWKFSLATLIWFALAAMGATLKIRLGYDKIGNFLIFRNAFWHMVHQTSLYSYYASEKLGSYLYGPSFSIVIAPFSLLTVNAGAFLWSIFNAWILFLSIRKLPVSYKNQNIILFASSIEMMTSIQNMQVNCMIAAIIIFSYIFIEKGKTFWATLFIAIGFLIKIYGVVGIAFFFFSKDRITFIASFVFWMVLLFCLPMLFSSFSFVVHSYVDWYHTLTIKNNANNLSDRQNISVMGMLSHIFGMVNPTLMVIFTASWFYLLPFFRTTQYSTPAFQLSYLSFVLIGVVIFSSSAESPTYIIAVTGVSIWFILRDTKHFFEISLLVFTLVVTSLSSTDFFPSYIKSNLIYPYSLKALPCFLVWITLAYQLLKKDFKNVKTVQNFF
jgi:hypothetical protein